MHAYRTLAIAGAGAIALAATVAGAANAESLPFNALTLAPTTTTTSGSPTSSGSPTPSVSPSPSVSPTSSAPADVITVDIHVELGFPAEEGPLVFEAFGVPVGDGPEMINPTPVSNPEEYCGDAYVDIDLDPTTITLGGGEGYCDFAEAYFEITLHGAEFSSVTLTSNTLFEDVPLDEALGTSGGLFKSRALHFGPSDPSPVLDSYGVSGSRFAAWWSGANGTDMSGLAGFTWAPIARAAGGAGGSPAFTG